MTIESVHDAVETLLRDWPKTTGEHYMLALRACIDAIADRSSPDLAREALVRAAAEAGMSALS